MCIENCSKDELTGKKLIYDYYFHESDRISSRTDWFLIFHAILLEAFFAVSEDNIARVIIVGSLGVVCSYIWLFNGLRAYRIAWQLGNMLGDKSEMGELADMQNKIFKDRDDKMSGDWYTWAKHVPLFAVVTPAIFLLAWEMLLIFSWPGASVCAWILIVVAVLSGSLIMMWAIYKATKNIDGNFRKYKKAIPEHVRN